jgi:hypothetical protein
VSDYRVVTLGTTLAAKRVYGGIQPIPTQWQPTFGGKTHLVGWGGYTSLMDQGGKCSLGPSLYAIPDPAGYAHGAIIPDSDRITVSDHASPKRGRRVTLPLNYYDGGDPRQNPSTPPTIPPVPAGRFLSPGSDGLGYMVWGDSYYNTVPGLGNFGGPGNTGNAPAGNLNGATFDATTNRIYAIGCALGGGAIKYARLYVWGVN